MMTVMTVQVLTDWRTLVNDWKTAMERDTGLAMSSIHAYASDGMKWADWANRQGIRGPEEVTAQDLKEWRDARETGAGAKASTANRRMIAVRNLLTFCGRTADNPARKIGKLYDVNEEDGRALSRNEWNAVRRAAESLENQRASALAAIFRYAGLRVGEVCPHASDDPVPLRLGDVTLTARAGEVVVRQGKGRKGRKVPLVVEAREPLRQYLDGDRREKIDDWAKRRDWTEEQKHWWLYNPNAPVFLGERGPITVRAARRSIVKLGVMAHLDFMLGPHDLRATFITALVDPDKYGIARTPVPLTVAAKLAGHSDVQTTARYANPSQDDLMRWMMGAAGD